MAAVGGGWALLILKQGPAYIFICDKLCTKLEFFLINKSRFIKKLRKEKEKPREFYFLK
jgi:hypothetical protein